MLKMEDLVNMFSISKMQENIANTQKAILDQADKNMKAFFSTTESVLENMKRAYDAADAVAKENLKKFNSSK